MYEKDFTMSKLFYINNNSDNTSTLTDAEEEQKQLEESIYNAIDKYYTDNPRDYTISVDSSRYVIDSTENDALEFASSTDSTLYTVTVAGGGATSSPQQATALLLEIRNLILIFMFAWICITLYSKIKNLMINYTTKD